MKKFLFVFALIAFVCSGVQVVTSFNDCMFAGRGCYARSYLQQFMQLSDNNRSGCYARSYLQQFMQLSDNNRSGCCSRHGGVCGCSGGRTKCCDGTLSPTCQCFMDDMKNEFKI